MDTSAPRPVTRRRHAGHHLPPFHTLTTAYRGADRLHRGLPPVSVVDREHLAVHHHAREAHDSRGGGPEGGSRRGGEVHTAVTRQPLLGRCLERALDARTGRHRPRPAGSGRARGVGTQHEQGRQESREAQGHPPWCGTLRARGRGPPGEPGMHVPARTGHRPRGGARRSADRWRLDNRPGGERQGESGGGNGRSGLGAAWVSHGTRVTRRRRAAGGGARDVERRCRAMR